MIDEPFLQDFTRKSARHANQSIIILLGALLALVILMVAAFSFVAVRSSQEKEYINIASDQRVLALQLVALSTEALRAKSQAYITLKERRDRFDANLKFLREGDPVRGLPPSPDTVMPELTAVTTQWNEFRENVDAILRAESAMKSLIELSRSFNAGVPQLQKISGETGDGRGGTEGVLTGRQLVLAQRIGGHINRIFQLNSQGVSLGDEFLRDLAEFETALGGQLRTNQDRASQSELRDTHSRFMEVRKRVELLRERLPEINKAQRAANVLFVNVDPLVDEISQLVGNYTLMERRYRIFTWTGYGAGAFALLVLVIMGQRLIEEARSREQASVSQAKVERDAILRLQHEIRTLGEGDLTVRATIERRDSTAAIAEAVNYMISALRELVAAINRASFEVASTAAETRATALHLTRGSTRQVEQITAVTEAVQKFAAAMEQVAADAQSSLNVAKQSVEIADHGANTVRQMIQAMVTTRETIQDTARRIKRLGESSQEIGNIVELINDIADQTHILALNAAIQARSGQTSSNIGTVADEVQQLAERTGYATRQIEALVKTIQQDTQEAVTSMAHSTHHVGEGTELAEGAGTALIAIQDVSADLADHILNISGTAQHLAGEALEMAEVMKIIMDVTHQHLSGTQQTAELTEHLAELSHTLRKMVSGFKLPVVDSET